MCHNSVRGRKDNVSKLPGWQQVHNPFLNFSILNIETRTNDTALVEAASQLNNNLVGTVVIDNFEFTNVSYAILQKERKNTSVSKASMWHIIRRNSS